jgi:hypothetical protein
MSLTMLGVIEVILIFFAVTVIGASIFCGWVVWTILRFILGAVTKSMNQSPTPVPPGAIYQNRTGTGNGNGTSATLGAPGPMMSASTVRCSRQNCLAHNPASAAFCRRCGMRLPNAQPVVVRRAAVW